MLNAAGFCGQRESGTGFRLRLARNSQLSVPLFIPTRSVGFKLEAVQIQIQMQLRLRLRLLLDHINTIPITITITIIAMTT
jgi:hypothetical protein